MDRFLDTGSLAGTWTPGPPGPDGFSRIATDSRSLVRPGATLFFCLRGPRHDGHAYIRDAWKQGVRSFVVDHIPAEPLSGARYLVVRDSLQALQDLAAAHRSAFSHPVIAITGSNGKTIVKEWLYQILCVDQEVFRSPRSYNSQVGVPLSLCMLLPGHQLALIEAGISRPGEMARLEAMIRPDIGILTSLGSAHDEGFTDRSTKLREKLRLFRSTSLLILPDEVLKAWPTEFEEFHGSLSTWSDSGPADLEVLDKVRTPESWKVRYRYRGKESSLNIPFPDDASYANALTCTLAALNLGSDPEVLAGRVAGLSGVSMRLETREGWNGNLVISDSYNADLEGLRVAVSFLQQRRGERQAWLILTDFEDSGLGPEALAAEIAILIGGLPDVRLSWIGSQGHLLAARLPSLAITVVPDVPAFLANSNLRDVRDTAILLKGARRFALEEITRELVRTVHQTRLEINLSALAHNLRVFSAEVDPGTRMMVMVKASAYGSGGTDIARLLESQRTHYLGVAYADEGVDLRRSGLQLPVMVMNPDEASFTTLVRYRLEPVIHSIIQLRQFLAFLSPADPVIPIHIKVETGMHRLGFDPGDLRALAELINLHGQVSVASCFSHLSASDDPRQDGFTHVQARRFIEASTILENELGYRPLRHLLNSAGIRRFPEYHFDMVRLGIGLYGLDAPEQDRPEALQFALSLKTTVSRVHEVGAGESVGYGRRGTADHDRRIATLGIGYADGLLRLAGDGRFSVRIGHRHAPTVGAICMDLCMVDVSGIPECREGDEVIVFDDPTSIGTLAATLQTIPYEVLTNISPRVNRLYFRE